VTTSSDKSLVLIVDDEADLCRLLAFNLEEAGFATHVVHNGLDALTAVTRLKPAVVVLDLMLPSIPGTEVCRRIRADPTTVDVGILMLTARSEEEDRVLGFELGTDDYLAKPFSVRELVFRVKALARRATERALARTAVDTGNRMRWRGMEVDPARHRVLLDGKELQLRPLEFKLLSVFMEHPGQLFSRQKLLTDVWGISPDVNTRTVDTHVRRLRERLGTYGDAIETVHGFGYRLADA